MKIKLLKLNWPQKSGLQKIGKILPEDYLIDLILHFANKSKKERIIEFPSLHVLKKIVCYHYGTLVEKEKMSWDEVMEELKEKFKTLKELDISRKEVKRLYLQRQKEIEKEIVIKAKQIKEKIK